MQHLRVWWRNTTRVMTVGRPFALTGLHRPPLAPRSGEPPGCHPEACANGASPDAGNADEVIAATSRRNAMAPYSELPGAPSNASYPSKMGLSPPRELSDGGSAP